MGREYHFWVYLLASRSRKVYIGMTNNLKSRVEQHRKAVPGTHTAHYQIYRLVYFEYYRYVRHAIARENELKQWTRAQKLELIGKVNPTWEDLMPVAPVFGEVESRFPAGMTTRKAKAKAAAVHRCYHYR